jgi:hypothetical protein
VPQFAALAQVVDGRRPNPHLVRDFGDAQQSVSIAVQNGQCRASPLTTCYTLVTGTAVGRFCPGPERPCLAAIPRTYDGRGERIRTSDILLPKQARYQAALRPVATSLHDARPAGAARSRGAG